MKLVLLRHGQSAWNLENRFTGWTDVGLTEAGENEAEEAGKLLLQAGFDFDICYTSFLKRAIKTLNIVLEVMDREYLPVIKDYRLNERHYGALQGLNKADTAAEYGEAQVKIWRRSYDVQPPALSAEDKRNPAFSPQYATVDRNSLPLTESLKDTVARTVPYYEDIIKKDITSGKRVIICAHGNSLRALVKYFDKLTNDEITEVNIPTGVPLVYEFSDNFEVIEKYYLGDDASVAEKMAGVAAQGKAGK